MKRLLMALKVAGVVVEWGQKAFSPEGEGGSEITKPELVDLAHRILQELDVNLEDLIA